MEPTPQLAPASADHLVGFATLPIASLLARGDIVFAANARYEELMGVRAADVVGRSVTELVRRFVIPTDVPLVDTAQMARQSGSADDGSVWCRVTDGRGRGRTLRVVWNVVPGTDLRVIHLLAADADADVKSLSEALARAGGELVRCKHEREVLERAVETLASQGFTATIMLIREGDPLLEYGPTRSALPSTGVDYERVRPPRELLTSINPQFLERRAAFYQSAEHVLLRAYPNDVANQLHQVLRSPHMVQAPLFVDDQPYGALVVTSVLLTPSLAGSIEMFAELVARAIENVRLHVRAEGRLDELKKLQGELVERERLAALGEAAAVLAHEVRNPVGAILNAAGVLRRNPEPTGTARAELLRVISEEALRLETLVSGLLDLGRPIVPRVQSVDLREIAEASVAVMQARHETDSCEVSLERTDHEVWAEADPDLLQLALINVIRNATQAASPGGSVHVAIRADDERVAIAVDDDGPGFSEEVAKRMFEPFFTTRATGTGIGLAVVRRAIGAIGGTIEVARSPSGGGRMVLAFARRA